MLPEFDLIGLIKNSLVLSDDEKKHYISFVDVLDEEQRLDLFLLLSRRQNKAVSIQKKTQEQSDLERADFLRAFEKDSQKILKSALEDFQKNEKASAEESLSHNLQNL